MVEVYGGYFRDDCEKAKISMGKVFKEEETGDKYIIVQTRAKECCLIHLGSGNRVADPIKVGDIGWITRDEFNKMAGRNLSPRTLILNRF